MNLYRINIRKQADEIQDYMEHTHCSASDLLNLVHELQKKLGNGEYPDVCEVFNKEIYNDLTALMADLSQIEGTVSTLVDKCDEYWATEWEKAQ